VIATSIPERTAFYVSLPVAYYRPSDIHFGFAGTLGAIELASVSSWCAAFAGAQLSPLRIGVVTDQSGSARGSGLQSAFLARGLDGAQTAIERNGGDAFLVGFNDPIIISTELSTDVGRFRSAAGSSVQLVARP
jgi:hypothetical protein